MIRLLLLFSVLTIWGISNAQSERNDCYDLATKALKSLPNLYETGQLDSLHAVLNNWERSCGKREITRRLRTLLLLEADDFIEIDFDFTHYNSLLGYLEDEKFKLLMDSVHEDPRELYLNFFQEPDLLFAYTNFTTRLAASIAQNKGIDLMIPSCKTSIMLLQVYAGYFDPFFQSIKNAQCNSQLSRYYSSQVQSIEKKAKVDAAIITGLWLPYGNVAVLGNHPSLGFLFGWGKRKMVYDFVIEFRFGKPRETYEVFHNGSVVSTNHYLGGYAGFDLGYELKNRKNSKWYLLAGVATDGFDSIKADPDQDVKTKSTFVLNLNGGIGWRTYSRDGSYFGIEARHNFINYKNTGGTNLDGNAVSLRLLFGLLKNDKRERELSHLKNIIP